jgi:cell division protein FtsA|tara:strand:+ start:8879 stop:10126 length:1248 start_codon:yes stop_codon:yes gene_type:complete
MLKEQIIIGLDVGTCFIRTVVAKIRPDNQIKPQIIGVGQTPSFGLRRGVVVDVEETTKNISQSIQAAERSSGLSIDQVVVSISGNHIASRPSKGVVAVSRADGEVSKEDVDRAISAAAAISLAQNREILHTIPRSFSVDSQGGISEPVGMSGVRLEVDTLIVEGAISFIKNLTKCISEAGLEIEELVLASLAASRSALGKRQKELGVLALDLGGGTAGLTVFEEGNILHSCVLPVGSSHITNDIAIGLRGGIDLAEKVKLEYGSALGSEISKKSLIDLSKLGLEGKGVVPRVVVAEIIEARLSEILELTNKELRKVDRQGLLPAGIVLLGGGAKMPGLVDLARDKLKLPVQVGFPLELEGIIDEVDDPTYATVIGLILWSMDKRIKGSGRGISLPEISIGPTIIKLKKWLSGFSP